MYANFSSQALCLLARTRLWCWIYETIRSEFCISCMWRSIPSLRTTHSSRSARLNLFYTNSGSGVQRPPWGLLAQFCQVFAPNQARMAPERMVSLAKNIKQYAVDQGNVRMLFYTESLADHFKSAQTRNTSTLQPRHSSTPHSEYPHSNSSHPPSQHSPIQTYHSNHLPAAYPTSYR